MTSSTQQERLLSEGDQTGGHHIEGSQDRDVVAHGNRERRKGEWSVTDAELSEE